MNGAFNQNISQQVNILLAERLSVEHYEGCKDDADIPQLDVLLWYLTHITKTPGPSPITSLSASAML